MSFSVFAVGESGCDCEEDEFLHHLTEPGVHFFTAKWCHFCQAIKKSLPGLKNGEIKEPHKYFEHEQSEIDLKKVNEKTVFGVTGFPTIYFVKRGLSNEPVTQKY